MKNFTLITALSLCIFSWISVSVSESQTVEVQTGQQVTLMCNSVSNRQTVAFWFRLFNRTNARCISVMIAGSADYCTGFQNGKFEMTSNISSVFLNIKQVDSSDSGLYFCGFYSDGDTSFSVIHLKVDGSDEPHDDLDSKRTKECDRTAKLTSVILGGLTVLFVHVVIGLLVAIRKHQTAAREEQNPRQHESLDSDDLKHADLSLYLTTLRCRRPESEREVDTRVLYTTSW